ncbi:protein late bloomer isoform X2 [Drosophila mauritiana]|uniref:Protein late bloomer isoform X2 n=1 Tax=Drosophila mauritiana TaxID=7226 RepID=A0A6P8JM02_DROMA|nr:protein late bloomer isoform X2 [Drosophila mauritiana]
MPTVRVCLQWTSVVFSTLTLIVGVLAALAGVYELDKFDEGSAEHTEKFVQLGMAGALILAGLVGCLGAIFGSIKVMVVNLILLLALIASHIWKVSHYNETKQLDATEVYVMDLWMKELVHHGAMQDLQQEYECCGDKGFSDYTSLNMKVPRSCFHTKDGIHALYPYAEGCMAAVKRAYLQIYRYEKWVHCGLIGYEVVGIILGITLCCQLTNKTRRYTY